MEAAAESRHLLRALQKKRTGLSFQARKGRFTTCSPNVHVQGCGALRLKLQKTQKLRGQHVVTSHSIQYNRCSELR